MGNEKYILAIDQSTSSTKVMLFDAAAKLIHRVSLSHEQYYPAEGFVEHDPEEIFSNTIAGMIEILKVTGKSVSDVAVISITNQRETSLTARVCHSDGPAYSGNLFKRQFAYNNEELNSSGARVYYR